MTTSLASIFQSIRPALLGIVSRIVSDRHIAEELVQDAYIRALIATKTTAIGNMDAYLRQTVRNLALDHVRRRKVRDRYETAEADRHELENVAGNDVSAEMALLERERAQLLADALAQLPVRARTAWILSETNGWTYSQIADHLGVSRNTVYHDIKMVLGHCHDALSRHERQ